MRNSGHDSTKLQDSTYMKVAVPTKSQIKATTKIKSASLKSGHSYYIYIYIHVRIYNYIYIHIVYGYWHKIYPNIIKYSYTRFIMICPYIHWWKEGGGLVSWIWEWKELIAYNLHGCFIHLDSWCCNCNADCQFLVAPTPWMEQNLSGDAYESTSGLSVMQVIEH